MLGMSVLTSFEHAMCIRTYNPTKTPDHPRCTNPKALGSDLCATCGTKYKQDTEARKTARENQRKEEIEFKEKVPKMEQTLATLQEAVSMLTTRLKVLEQKAPTTK